MIHTNAENNTQETMRPAAEQVQSKPVYEFFKRCFDIMFSVILQ